MPLRISIKTPDGSLVPIAEVKAGQKGGSFVDHSQGEPRLIVFECASDDKTSIIGEVIKFQDRIYGATRAIQSPKVDQLALLSDGEHFEIEVQNEENGPKAPFQFLHQKTKVSPDEVILGMFQYFQKNTMPFNEILMCAVAQVWGKSTPPPSDLMNRMTQNVKGILAKMVASGQMKVEKRSDGQNHYTLIKAN